MLLTYGKKFTDMWAATTTDDLVAFWGGQLAGYSGAEIKHGLDAMENRDWPPTLPEFKRMCRPPIEPLRAYYEALAGVLARFAGENGTWSHPAIYWTAMPMAAELREQTYNQIRARWEAALAQQLGKGEWDPIPQPMVALAAPGKSTTSTEKAREEIQHLVGSVLHRPAGGDRLAWAKELLERADAGEPMSPTQVEFAKQALANRH